ncbi:hypothetical protein CPIN18021_0304 [Campylobacter pinnipediorum subsp. caledonicus]|uniref:Uncharacterized protein n=1 Tax=Campylobacter pinnipediorum subsp. caledonicus TaxID=1874362 RepID=A0A1S6U5Y4_9BACT|nr:hypothetical protein [Campylobacter pinnipediorum]AQW85534.1 hypothetical protein CPIN18020_0290 [Campylobacter pinnipediorum subsp. caledonicus]AQW87151.1 hypothetical protein CPIN18021_0304 [Campylobacter pinnipediorum subsp. caledonicus]
MNINNNLYIALVGYLIEENKENKYICIDLRHYSVIKSFAKQHGFIKYNSFVGSLKRYRELQEKLAKDFVIAPIRKFLSIKNYTFKIRGDYLFIVKQFTLF